MNHDCEAHATTRICMRYVTDRWNWKALRFKPLYKVIQQKICVLCDKILEEQEVRDLLGWTVSLDVEENK
jgi:hypothetical protein